MRSIPFVVFALSATAAAQGPAFDSPGQTTYSTLGQTTRFSTEFNPALGFVIDGVADYVDAARGDDDGFDLSVRLLEFNAAAYVDPSLWAYVVIAGHDDLEEIEIEEVAGEYIGFEGNTTIKAGRFFVDFGKQMQSHLEELRTLERPLVLREYLGEELAGTGVQFDHWEPVGDATVVRASVGVFGSLLGEGHEHGEDEDLEPEAEVAERLDFEDLSFMARVTGMTDAGENGVLQLGGSARFVPEFAFHFDSLEENRQSNVVWGADATYSWTDDTGNRNLTLGGEALLFTGDLAAEVDDPLAPTLLTVVDDDVFGYYGFADFQWDPTNAAGVQYSRIEDPEDPRMDASELDVYVTHHFTEYRRLRLGVTVGDGLEADTRVYLQFTNFFGSHAHGLNW